MVCGKADGKYRPRLGSAQKVGVCCRDGNGSIRHFHLFSTASTCWPYLRRSLHGRFFLSHCLELERDFCCHAVWSWSMIDRRPFSSLAQGAWGMAFLASQIPNCRRLHWWRFCWSFSSGLFDESRLGRSLRFFGAGYGRWCCDCRLCYHNIMWRWNRLAIDSVDQHGPMWQGCCHGCCWLRRRSNDNWGIELKFFISNWKRFDLYFPLLKPKNWSRFLLLLLPVLFKYVPALSIWPPPISQKLN